MINLIKNFNKNKKGQEEMFGFVIIVILVIIIGIFLLVFSLKPKATSLTQSQIEADDFNHAMLSYITECKDQGNEKLNLRDLIKKCSLASGNKCNNLEYTYCDYLNKTLINITNNVLGNATISTAFIKGYVLNLYPLSFGNITIKQGNTTGTNYFSSSTESGIIARSYAEPVYLKIRYYYQN